MARTLEAVVIGGSAGSVHALGEILPRLPADFPPVLVVVHVLRSHPSRLAEVYASRCAMRVSEATPGEPLRRGMVYFAPSDYHLLVESDRRCALSIDPPVFYSRPAIDVLFESAAQVYRQRLAAVILTGASADGAEGLQAVHAAGGLTLVQDPITAEASVMPAAALGAVPTARVSSLSQIASELIALAGSHP